MPPLVGVPRRARPENWVRTNGSIPTMWRRRVLSVPFTQPGSSPSPGSFSIAAGWDAPKPISWTRSATPTTRAIWGEISSHWSMKTTFPTDRLGAHQSIHNDGSQFCGLCAIHPARSLRSPAVACRVHINQICLKSCVDRQRMHNNIVARIIFTAMVLSEAEIEVDRAQTPRRGRALRRRARPLSPARRNAHVDADYP